MRHYNSLYTGGSVSNQVGVGRCYLYSSLLVNVSATIRYGMFFDTSTLPVNGATPVISIPVFANGGTSELGVEVLREGFWVGSGLAYAVSTSPLTLTLAGAAEVNSTICWR